VVVRARLSGGLRTDAAEIMITKRHTGLVYDDSELMPALAFLCAVAVIVGIVIVCG